MSGRGFRVKGARLLCAAAASALLPAPLLAQVASPPPDPAELDPNAPLEPMPDLGVAWPELNAKVTVPPPTAPATRPRGRRTEAIVAGDMRYTVRVEGLGPVGHADELLRDFRGQSALEA